MVSPSSLLATMRALTVLVTGTSIVAEPSKTYIANNASLVNIQLPPASEVGDEITILGMGAGKFAVVQGDGQSITYLTTTTTVGTGGSLTAGNLRDSLTLRCIVRNTTWTVVGPKGTFTVA